MGTLRDLNASNTDETTHVDALRETMIGELCEMGAIRSDQVAEAFRAVPRHLFAPGAPPAAVYAATSSVVTKRDDHGFPISSISAPELQAFMLEQAAIRPGMTVLEIGSGGCNAALLAELVGSEGTVTTVDIDPEVTDRASSIVESGPVVTELMRLTDDGCGQPAKVPATAARSSA